MQGGEGGRFPGARESAHRGTAQSSAAQALKELGFQRAPANWGLLYFAFFFFCFLGPYLLHMEIPRRGVELQL